MLLAVCAKAEGKDSMQKAKQSVKIAVKTGRKKTEVFSVFIYSLYGAHEFCQGKILYLLRKR